MKEYYIIAASYLVFALMVLFITGAVSLILFSLLLSALFIITGTAIYVKGCYTLGEYKDETAGSTL